MVNTTKPTPGDGADSVDELSASGAPLYEEADAAFAAACAARQPLPSTFSVPAPTFAELTSGDPGRDAGLNQLMAPRKIEEHSTLAAAARVGRTLRLWLPSREAARRFGKAMTMGVGQDQIPLADVPSPAAVAGAWMRSLPEREVDALERLAIESLGRLFELRREKPNRRAWMREVMQLREQAAGLQALLWLAPGRRGRMLSQELRCVDTELELPFCQLCDRKGGMPKWARWDLLALYAEGADVDAWWATGRMSTANERWAAAGGVGREGGAIRAPFF
jgi:hypothetical protein